jgi:protocatechuate 3,4-dioxygenase beta subunit
MTMARYTLIVETEDGKALKIDGAVLDQEGLPVEGGVIRFKAKRIIEIKKGV